jgi:hypothetical protein
VVYFPVVRLARELAIAISFGDFGQVGVPVILAAFGGSIVWVLLVS